MGVPNLRTAVAVRALATNHCARCSGSRVHCLSQPMGADSRREEPVMALTPEQLAEIRAHLDHAHAEVKALCQEPYHRWRMSIPAQPDRDSDLIISAGLKAGDDALAEVDRLTAENKLL